MMTPSDDDVRAALEAHAVSTEPDQWWFRTHPMNVYTEAEALTLTRINLMLGTTPNGSLSAEMLLRIVERIADLELRQWQADESAAERLEREG